MEGVAVDVFALLLAAAAALMEMRLRSSYSTASKKSSSAAVSEVLLLALELDAELLLAERDTEERLAGLSMLGAAVATVELPLSGALMMRQHTAVSRGSQFNCWVCLHSVVRVSLQLTVCCARCCLCECSQLPKSCKQQSSNRQLQYND